MASETPAVNSDDPPKRPRGRSPGHKKATPWRIERERRYQAGLDKVAKWYEDAYLLKDQAIPAQAAQEILRSCHVYAVWALMQVATGLMPGVSVSQRIAAATAIVKLGGPGPQPQMKVGDLTLDQLKELRSAQFQPPALDMPAIEAIPTTVYEVADTDGPCLP